MSNKTFALILSFALTAVGGLSLAKGGEKHSDSTETNLQTDTSIKGAADAGLTLSETADGGITGALLPGFDPGFLFNEDDRILKINDTYTKGLSLSQLQKMLTGAEGENVKITVLANGGRELTIRNLKMEFPQNRKIAPWSDNILVGADFFERPNPFSNNLRMAQSNDKRGTLIFVGAALRDLLNHQPYANPPKSDAEVLVSIPYSLNFFDKSAMFEESDRAIEFALKMSKRNLKGVFHPEILACTKTAQYLEETNRFEKASVIWQNLYASVGDTKPADQMVILSGFIRFLINHPSYGPSQNVCDRLEKLCAQNPGKSANDGLTALAEFYFKNNSYDKAANAYRVVADEQKKSFDMQRSHYLRYQDAVLTLVRLSEIYLAKNDLPASCASLKEALALYDDNMQADEIVQLERGFSPSYSEIQTRLAKAYTQAGNHEEATKVMASAKTGIETAFGKNAPQLSRLQNANIDYIARNKEFYNLNPNWLAARKAYDFLEEKKIRKALSLIEERVTWSTKTDPVDRYEIFRLFNLARELSKQDRKEAIAVLDKLLHVAQKDSRSGMKATILGEMVFLLEQEGNKAAADTRYNELEKELFRINCLNYPNMKDQSRTSAFDAAQHNINRVKTIALYFRFIGETKVARCLLERLQPSLSSKDALRGDPAVANLAVAQEMQGPKDQAIESYLETALVSLRRQDSENVACMENIEKALTLMLEQSDIQDSTFAKLKKCLGRISVKDESKLMSEQILTLAKKKSDRELLLHEEEFELAAAVAPAVNSNANIDDNERTRARINAEIKKRQFENAAKLIISELEADSKRINTQFHPHPGNRKTDLFIQDFETGGRLDLTEQILKRAFELDQQRDDRNNPNRLINGALLVDVYAKNKKNSQALSLAKQILSINEKNTDQSTNSHNTNFTCEMLLWAVDTFIKNGQLDAASELSESLLNTYEKHAGSKNSAFVNLYERFASIAKSKGDIQSQKLYLTKALDIASYNWGLQGRMTAPIRMKYASVLRELGEQTQADKLEAIQPPPFKHLDERVLYGTRHIFSSHSPPPDAFADSAEAVLIEALQDSTTRGGISGDGFGRNSNQIRDSLIDFYLARKKYDQAEKLILEKLQILKNIEGDVGTSSAACMNELACLHLAKGDRTKALEWVVKAEKTNPSDFGENNINSAAIRLELGDKNEAIKLLLPFAKRFDDKYNFFSPSFAKCAYLLTQLGQTAEVARLTQLYESKMANRRAYFGGYSSKSRVEPVFELQNGVWIRKTRAIKIIDQDSTQRQYRQKLFLKNQTQSELEHLRNRLPANVYEAIKRNKEQMHANRAQREATAEEANKARLTLEEGRKDYATARIVALQEATQELQNTESKIVSEQLKERNRNESLLQNMLTKLERAKENKVSEPSLYLTSLWQVSSAYQVNNKAQEAQEARIKAMNEFLDLDNRKLRPSTFGTVADCFVDAIRRGKMPLEEALPFFKKIAEKAERMDEEHRDDVNDSIYEIISQSYDVREKRSDTIVFYENWVAIRKKVHGASNISLYPLLTNLAVNYLMDDKLQKAKQTYLECRAVVAKDPHKRFQNELNYAVCLGKLGEAKEAEKCWKDAGKANNWICDKRSYRSFKYLAQKLKSIKLVDQAKEIEDMLNAANQFKDD